LGGRCQEGGGDAGGRLARAQLLTRVSEFREKEEKFKVGSRKREGNQDPWETSITRGNGDF